MFDITDETQFAQRAEEDHDFIIGYESLDDRRVVIRREDGEELTYQFTDEQVGDAYTVVVSIDHNPGGDEPATHIDTKYLHVLSEDDLTAQLYDQVIVPWAAQNEVP
ncbi:hypothetical protein BJF89_15990 [Corynebacterium sp. CNJ-954]|uniref:hypothetical protein n=1 Tax=Corynebacterium sp. CNJ-954 TaxID=1904962 RepID=UPI000961E241|nr:hypothetical protein [Corynebacterium sp. CNJ-954]OLT55254.1 hypothetical protein BJF89_15990 [Corynebacterium sp. CNJ-954]